jgi:hypothetical protein
VFFKEGIGATHREHDNDTANDVGDVMDADIYPRLTDQKSDDKRH